MTTHKYFVNNCLPGEEIFKMMSRKGFLNGIDRKGLLEGFGFYEFDLSELGLPSHSEIVASTKNLLSEVACHGWKSKGVEHRDYSGVSLTYNPSFSGAETSIYHQTMGDIDLTQSFAREKGAPNFSTKGNTYYDTAAFRQIPPLVGRHYHNLLQITKCAISRSRIGVLHPKYYDPINETGANWHKDECPFELFRVNIPVITSEEHVLLIEGSDEFGNTMSMRKHLAVGKAYIWNTRIPHTVFAPADASHDARIHIVLGILPYLSYNQYEDSFSTNSLYGMKMTDIIKEKLWCI